jgi:hypothetical protein
MAGTKGNAMTERFDPEPILNGLKDFQRHTVDYVFERMYGPDPTHRFLVADEVGLGKTLVARGLVAMAIEHLWDKVERIDVVYICSNSDIARQNIRRLNVTEEQAFAFEQRLTLLASRLHNLTSNKLNFVAFTPGTSFNLKDAEGTKEERALLWWYLREILGKATFRGERKGVLRVFQGWVTSLDRFKGDIRRAKQPALETDPSLISALRKAIRSSDLAARRDRRPTLGERLEDLAVRWRYEVSDRPQADKDDRRSFIGDLRGLLANAVVTALEPDIVILDEFQRFKHLLDAEDEAALLARGLFDFDGDSTPARTLLLSATPYKMYTLAEEAETDDHYQDFIRTARFLMGDAVDSFSEELAEFRYAVFALGSEPGATKRAVDAKNKVERSLSRVMTRTERLATSVDRNGMLVSHESPECRLESSDLNAYLTFDRLAEIVGAPAGVEYWKSIPYFINFMDGYALGRRFEYSLEDPEVASEVRAALKHNGLLDWGAMRRYKPIDPGNPRLRDLLASVMADSAWQLLWVPPSLPYYRPNPPFDKAARFTKRLIFSAWNGVPRSVSTITSYEVERQLMRAGTSSRANTPEDRQKISELLKVTTSKGRLTGMPVVGLVYPSPSLARLGDPLGVATKYGRDLPAKEVLSKIRAAIAAELAPWLSEGDGRADEAWYWAAPLILDGGAASDWLAATTPETFVGETHRGTSGLALHLDEAHQMATGDISLGPPPGDLLDVLALIAVASPGNCALRAVSRVTGLDPGDVEARDAAARIAWELRNLFNLPEPQYLLQAKVARGQPYWQRVLHYALAGNLQSVLDEYAHVVREWRGIVDLTQPGVAGQVAEEMADAIAIRSADYEARDPQAEWADGKRRIRSRHALQFGQRRTDELGAVQRATQVRTAFNSPFWPFVLASTSVGQEGLDFHLYCHAVVHWNVPSNPVDLEQREGRVHRYKGHAIRRNLAERYGQAAFEASDSDPWHRMFEVAVANREAGETDLVPFWILPGQAKIERHVPMLPLSREVPRLANLKRTLALYRLVFGQPRQEDLVEFLLSRGLEEEMAEELAKDLRIDLSPSR